MFDLTNEDDAQEWYYGHDCESDDQGSAGIAYAGLVALLVTVASVLADAVRGGFA